MQISNTSVLPGDQNKCELLRDRRVHYSDRGHKLVSKALQVFKQHWDKKGVHVNAWMVDKQLAEQAASKQVFPDSEIYLFNFHHLQAWERQFKTSKFGLSAHRDEGMALLQAVADSCPQAEYKRNLHALKNSYVWTKHRSTLPAYFQREWQGNEEVLF